MQSIMILQRINRARSANRVITFDSGASSESANEDKVCRGPLNCRLSTKSDFVCGLDYLRITQQGNAIRIGPVNLGREHHDES